jgi:hypothetical protein
MTRRIRVSVILAASSRSHGGRPMHADVDAAVSPGRRTFTVPERYRDWAMCAGFALVGLLLAGLTTYVEAGGSRANGTSSIAGAVESQSERGLFLGVP